MIKRCVQYLLQHKADPTAKDARGYTAVHYAVKGQNSEGLVCLLAAIGSKHSLHGPNLPTITPLHLAVSSVFFFYLIYRFAHRSLSI